MNIGLRQAGKIQCVIAFPDDTPVAEAKDEWARITGHLDPCWDDKKKTYYGWPVVITNAKALTRGAVKPLFYY